MTDGSAMRIAVIGGGIAGASAAYALANHTSRPNVMLLEAEQQLAHHTTGRSAALLLLNYGADPIRPLTKVSLPFMREPPPGFCDQPLLTEQARLTVGTHHQGAILDADIEAGLAVNPDVREISIQEASAMFPPLRPDVYDRALLEPGAFDIDVAGLHQGFIRGLRALGGEIATSARVDAATRLGSGGSGSGWLLETTDGDRHADLVVNAAGAWGDVVAERAGVAPVGLMPKRRTAFMVESRWPDSKHWPMTNDAGMAWYIKPDGSQFLCSPADETPSAATDAKPEEVDIALAIDRINAATSLEIRSVRSSWAGLRTFTEDRSMVIGPDPEAPDFIWCVGQGGTGIQTSPGAGQLVADLSLDGRPGPMFSGVTVDDTLDLAGLAPDRFRR